VLGWIDAPAGAPLKLNTRGEFSTSLAAAVKPYRTSSSIVAFAGTFESVGGSFTALTVIVTVTMFESAWPSFAL